MGVTTISGGLTMDDASRKQMILCSGEYEAHVSFWVDHDSGGWKAEFLALIVMGGDDCGLPRGLSGERQYLSLQSAIAGSEAALSGYARANPAMALSRVRPDA